MKIGERSVETLGFMEGEIQSGEIIHKRYCILYELGRGSWSRMYLAMDLQNDRDRCVLKMFSPATQNPEAQSKAVHLFEEEAKVLSQLRHRQIPKFRELFRGTYKGREYWCCVQDCVKGLNYRELLQLRQQQGRIFSEGEIIQWLWQLLPVFAYIHKRGTIHGDIALENVMLRQTDKLPVIIDFSGIDRVAILLKSENEQAFYPGKAGYAPPEQLHQGILSPQSDLYALGVTALVLLTGREPKHLQDAQAQDWDWESIPLRPELRAILQQMLAPDPGDRFTDAPRAIRAIKALLPPPPKKITQKPKPTPPKPPDPPIPVQSSEFREVATLVPQAGQNSEFRIQNLEGGTFHETSVQRAELKPSSSTPPTPPASPASKTPLSPRPPVPPSPPSPPPPVSETLPRKLAIAAGKVALVALLSLCSGTMGWWVGKAWIAQQVQSQTPEPVEATEQPEPEALSFLPKDDPEPDPPEELPAAERQRKLALRDRRIQLGINYDFFTALVDRKFGQEYPFQQGRTLTPDPEDAPWRDRWDIIGEELLDTLAQFDTQARLSWGRNKRSDRDRPIAQAEELNVSRRALFDLTDAAFVKVFPEQAEEEFRDGPFGQIWQSMMTERLQGLKAKTILDEIVLRADSLSAQREGTLQPGQGQVFLVRLQGGQYLSVSLDAPSEALFSVYSPGGEAVLLDDSADRAGAGQVWEDGFYQLTIVSRSATPLDYRLNLLSDRE